MQIKCKTIHFIFKGSCFTIQKKVEKKTGSCVLFFFDPGIKEMARLKIEKLLLYNESVISNHLVKKKKPKVSKCQSHVIKLKNI
jgi:hypothetical protein